MDLMRPKSPDKQRSSPLLLLLRAQPESRKAGRACPACRPWAPASSRHRSVPLPGVSHTGDTGLQLDSSHPVPTPSS